ncbi:MAG TPA: DUF72 domain-containing protein [Candidatus Aminicenantes bacterium]|nr:DUF72 domain-containing protein [Candidatus Aminicenantes bacterium]
MESPYLYGPCGWSYPDWKGTVYPNPKPRGFSPLLFIADRFDFVEVNTTFYRIPTPSLCQGWVEQTRPLKSFLFWVKLHKSFSHEGPFDPSQAGLFLEGISPLAESGRLAGLLLQFPYSFSWSRENALRLTRTAELFPGQTLAVEFRHRSWERPEVLDLFRSREWIWTNVDLPDLSLNPPLTDYATGKGAAYFRLHGRNASSWFSGEGRDSRYDYDYSLRELEEIALKIRSLPRNLSKVFIAGNNHYRGGAVRNLESLRRLLSRPEAL